MNPDRPFEGWTSEKSHSLGQGFSKSLLNETPQKKIGTCENEKKREEDVIGQEDHIEAIIRTLDYQVVGIRVSEHQAQDFLFLFSLISWQLVSHILIAWSPDSL
jgi:hypothetical protein